MLKSPLSLPYCSEVKFDNNRPCLYINGEKIPPLMYGLSDIPASKSWTAQAQKNIGLFGKNGINIVQVDSELRLGWKKAQPFDITPIQKEVAGAVNANKNAAVIIRLHINPPNWWIKEHPEENNIFEDGAGEIRLDDDSERLIGRDKDFVAQVSFASPLWLKEAGKNLKLLCQKLSVTEAGGHVIGIQVACGCYGEWHYWGFGAFGVDHSIHMLNNFKSDLVNRYQTVENLQKSWHNPNVNFNNISIPKMKEINRCEAGIFRDLKQSMNVVDYLKTLQKTIAQDIIFFAKIVKENWPRAILSGTFFGYTYCGPYSAICGHLEVNSILKSPYIDYLSGPFVYDKECRDIGGIGLARSLVESVRLNKKLWLTEMDQCPKGLEYCPGGDPKYMDETIAILKRNILEPLTHGMGMWFYDHRIVPSGNIYEKTGWWESELLQNTIAKYKAFFDKKALEPYVSAAEVAIVFGTQSYYYITQNHENLPFQTATTLEIIKNTARAGVPFDCIDIKDIELVDWNHYRTVIFASNVVIFDEQRKQIANLIAKNERHLLFCYGTGYSNGEEMNIDFMSQLSGNKVSYCNPQPKDPYMTPAFEVVNNYAKQDNWHSWSYPNQYPSTAELTTIFNKANVHIFTQDYELVLASNEWIAIHSQHGGKGKIALKNNKIIEVDIAPNSTTLLDAMSGLD